MAEYKQLPEAGIVPLGFYNSRYGRVWVTKAEPEWVYDTRTTGHYEERYQTQMEGCDGVYQGLVTTEDINRAFEERNRERRIQDSLRW